MKQVCLLALSMLLACSGGEGTPAAKVGSTEHDRQTDPMVEENKRIALREELDIDGWEKRQDLVGDAWLVRHTEHGQLGFVAVKGDTGNDRLFHVSFFLNGDERAFPFILKAGKHAQFDLVLAGEFD